MLIGTEIKGYSTSILDVALSGNLIPQLEKVEVTNIEVLSEYCFDDLFSFFRKNIQYKLEGDGHITNLQTAKGMV